MPLLRGFFYLAVTAAVLAVVTIVVLKLAEVVLRRLGIDWNELRAYNARKKRYLEQLKQLEGQLPPLDVDSPQFEQAAMTLKAFQETEPEPPRWAFWLRRS